MKWAVLCGVLSCLLVSGEGARILAFLPFPAKSHFAVFAPLIRELAKNGHEIVTYTPNKMSNPPPTYKEILIPNVMEEMLSTIDLNNFGAAGPIGEIIGLREMGLYFVDKVLQMEEVQDLIHTNEKFDFLIMESFFVQEAFSVFQHKFNAPAMEIVSVSSSSWAYYWAGAPFNPAINVEFQSASPTQMSFIDRLKNTINVYATIGLGYWYLSKQQQLADKYIQYDGWESRPSLNALLAEKSLIIQSSHLFHAPALALPPNIIDVGGVNVQSQNKPLPKEIQTFMDGAKDGVIFFSLGSNLKTSDVEKMGLLDIFKNVFGKLKQKVLWKWERPEMPGKPSNVLISSWFPQQDILAHKNLKLFITHGGFMSIAEAANNGVPLVGIPFFGDQPRNMKLVQESGWGVELQLGNITEESLSWAIQEATKPQYKEKALFKQRVFKERPMTAVQNGVYWMEYAIKFKGAPHLRPAKANTPCWKQLNLDVWALFLSPLLIGILSFKCIMCKLRSKSNSKKVDQKKKKQ